MELVEPVLHQDRGLILYSFLNDATIFIAIFIAMSLETDKNVYLFHPCSDKKEPHEIERDDKLFHSNAVRTQVKIGTGAIRRLAIIP